ncbi:MAG: putative universal stress protein [Candidatus Thorarchaeota archaeon]|nr:MAG: putative universal stress protein [Candidatus Thorarchaeota archaeon]
MVEPIYCEPGRLFCRTKRVMLPVDGSEGSARAAKIAYEIAEMTKAKLLVVHVINLGAVQQVATMSDNDIIVVLQRYMNNGRKLLEKYRSEAEEFDIDCELVLEKGLPSDKIVLLSRNREVDLVVMGSEGASGDRRVGGGLGSSTERVVRRSRCPVLVVK